MFFCWFCKFDCNDFVFCCLDDWMNFVVYVVVFLVINFGLWFVYNLNKVDWFWLIFFLGIWLGGLFLYLLYIVVIVDYFFVIGKS